MRLSTAQQEALVRLGASEAGSAYGLGVSVATLRALGSMRLAASIGTGHISLPRSAVWAITEAGRRALTALPDSATPSPGTQS